jgi:hypothetical protein
MTRYLVIYEAPVSAQQQLAESTPEQTQAGMDAWMAWASKADDAIVDLGQPLGTGRSITSDGVGDYRGTATGYSVVEAGSLDEVVELLSGHPHLHTPGGSIVVLEGLPTPG